MGEIDKLLMMSMLESLFNDNLIDINVYNKARADIEKL